MLSTRQRTRQNLLVTAVNAALEQGLITLECEPIKKAVFEFEVGGLPAIGSVFDAGFDEVSIKTIVCPTEVGREHADCAIHHEFRRYGEATTFAWLERRDGKYLQSSVNYHGTKAVTDRLSKLKVMPLGFDTKPIKGGYDFHRECEHIFGRSSRS